MSRQYAHRTIDSLLVHSYKQDAAEITRSAGVSDMSDVAQL